MKIEMGKKYKLADGTPVRRVLAVDMIDTLYPVLVELEAGGVLYFSALGKAPCQLNQPDLVEVSEWEDFKIDEPVMVRNYEQKNWSRRHFAEVSPEGKPYTWLDGKTSFTATAKSSLSWNYCRRPTKEELGE